MQDGHILLGDFMTRNNLSQADVARALDVPPPYVHAWLNDNKRPGVVFVLSIERFAKIPAAAWLTDKERAQLKAVAPLKRRAA